MFDIGAIAFGKRNGLEIFYKTNLDEFNDERYNPVLIGSIQLFSDKISPTFGGKLFSIDYVRIEERSYIFLLSYSYCLDDYYRDGYYSGGVILKDGYFTNEEDQLEVVKLISKLSDIAKEYSNRTNNIDSGDQVTIDQTIDSLKGMEHFELRDLMNPLQMKSERFAFFNNNSSTESSEQVFLTELKSLINQDCWNHKRIYIIDENGYNPQKGNEVILVHASNITQTNELSDVHEQKKESPEASISNTLSTTKIISETHDQQDTKGITINTSGSLTIPSTQLPDPNETDNDGKVRGNSINTILKTYNLFRRIPVTSMKIIAISLFIFLVVGGILYHELDNRFYINKNRDIINNPSTHIDEPNINENVTPRVQPLSSPKQKQKPSNHYSNTSEPPTQSPTEGYSDISNPSQNSANSENQTTGNESLPFDPNNNSKSECPDLTQIESKIDAIEKKLENFQDKLKNNKNKIPDDLGRSLIYKTDSMKTYKTKLDHISCSDSTGILTLKQKISEIRNTYWPNGLPKSMYEYEKYEAKIQDNLNKISKNKGVPVEDIAKTNPGVTEKGRPKTGEKLDLYRKKVQK